jgi:3D (Asp-Asp-Asp) domain-containing protein
VAHDQLADEVPVGRAAATTIRRSEPVTSSPCISRRVVLVALLGALLVSPSRLSWASHFSWLGHGADAPAGSTSLGPFVPTFYRILDEAAPEWPKDAPSEPLLSRDGHLIARVSAVFKKRLDVEGSARLRDGRVVNLDEPVNGQPRYLAVHNARFGLGAPGYKLIPYRTIAVDPRRIKLGTVLYVPSLAGIALPSGEVHDGFCFAHDVGHGITGDRIDIFVPHALVPGREPGADSRLSHRGRARPVTERALQGRLHLG